MRLPTILALLAAVAVGTAGLGSTAAFAGRKKRLTVVIAKTRG